MEALASVITPAEVETRAPAVVKEGMLSPPEPTSKVSEEAPVFELFSAINIMLNPYLSFSNYT